MIMFELDCVEIYKKDGFKDAIINAVLKGNFLICINKTKNIWWKECLSPKSSATKGREREHFLEIFKIQVDGIILQTGS